jgi:hypothetical protein
MKQPGKRLPAYARDNNNSHPLLGNGPVNTFPLQHVSILCQTLEVRTLLDSSTVGTVNTWEYHLVVLFIGRESAVNVADETVQRYTTTSHTHISICTASCLHS